MRAQLEVRPAFKEEIFKDLVRVAEKFRPEKNGTICKIRVGKHKVFASVVV